MPVPKRKRSRQRRDKRFANKGIDVKSIGGCAQCDAPVVGHHACLSCGFYKGRKVMTTKVEKKLKQAETRSKKAKASPQSSESSQEE